MSHDLALASFEQARATAPDVAALAALSSRRDALAALTPRIAAVQRDQGRIDAANASLAANEVEARAGIASLAESRARQAEIETESPTLYTRLEEAKRACALSAAAADEAAERLRATLVPGEPCPVCGSSDHATAALTSIIDTRAAEDQMRCRALEEEATAFGREAAVLTDRITAGEARRSRLADEARDQHSVVAAARTGHGVTVEALRAGLEACGLEFGGDLVLLQKGIDGDIALVDTSRLALQQAQEALEHARSVEQSARAKLGAAEATQREAAEATREATQHAQTLTRRSDDTRTNRDRLAASLDTWLQAHFDWKTERDPAGRLTELVSEWRQRRETHAAGVAAVPGLVAATHTADLLRQRGQSALETAARAASEQENRRDALASERAKLLDGEPADVVAERLAEAVRGASARNEAARDRGEKCRNAVAAAQASLAQCRLEHESCVADQEKERQLLVERLDAAALSDEEVAREAAEGEGALQAEADALAALDQDIAIKAAECASRTADRDAHAIEDSPALAGEELAAALAGATDVEASARETMTEAELVIRRDDDARAATATLRAELVSAKLAAAPWLRLEELIGDATGNRFRKFAQGLTLDRLVVHANIRLQELQPRYSLERGSGGEMLLQVVDHDMAGEVRGLQNLSGGERFLVSLALALGLAEMSTGRGLYIESLFIDEGFGALDSTSLGSAIALLEQLHATGRRVGVISHIDEVKERIPVKIAVTPIARGRSKVETLVS
jgi:exonuclease SbcC